MALWSAFKPVPEGIKVADALESSGTDTSFPNVVDPAEPAAAFLTMALGSNFPTYVVVDVSSSSAGVEETDDGDGMDRTDGDGMDRTDGAAGMVEAPAARLSISSSR